ncbi:hypothetical protein [Pseudomonas izuensis]|uniref:Uncharacterized protein n=1 Tax=Pseudomonas izuensis TaxID=2684212 RepID=A0ABM7S273_9PSED|nr:hypothetical protein [Pseudomonas izuensis]BCX68968.1 hypothetical protein LAB08_R36100 [Pseudomonas izuensis]
MSISSGAFEIAPQITRYIHQPDASAIVLGYEWMVDRLNPQPNIDSPSHLHRYW